jgi:hypothetical protein
MRDATSYAFRWLFRTYNIVELRNVGVHALQYDPITPLRHVKLGFPDQRNWLGESLNLSIGEVISEWGYKGSLETFSVMLCVLCDAGIQTYDVKQIRVLQRRIVEKRKAFLETNGYEGHPFLIIREADLKAKRVEQK